MILDLFAGPGGWSEGLRSIGLSDVGIEWDAAACATRAAAGHATIRADVAQYPTEPFAGKVTGLIASPPCQDFSMAGKRAGRTGDKGQLIDEVPRWVDALRPEWVACEQVPPALEVWEEFAELFRSWGYSAWCGILNAADFGVPQTRKRAILVASRLGAALPPEPTHDREPVASLFGPELRPWVSMAEALGWGHGFAVDRRTNSRAAGGGLVPTVTVPMSRPAPTGIAGGQWKLIDRQPNGAVRCADEPAPTITGSLDNGNKGWVYERPATTVCADPRLSPPGYRGRPEDYADDGTYTGERSMDNAVKLTIGEALVLQSFAADYPVQGTKTKQFEQIGNAVPPVLAAAVISALVPETARSAA